MVGKSLAGTRRAYDTCGGCGHARVRHIAGRFSCTGFDHPFTTGPDGAVHADTPTPCPCHAYTEQEGQD